MCGHYKRDLLVRIHTSGTERGDREIEKEREQCVLTKYVLMHKCVHKDEVGNKSI